MNLYLRPKQFPCPESIQWSEDRYWMHVIAELRAIKGAYEGYVYFVEAMEGVGRIKIGFTSRNPFSRMEELQTGSPVRLRLHGIIGGSFETEAAIHRALHDCRLHGEWFDIDADMASAQIAMFGGKIWVPACATGGHQ